MRCIRTSPQWPLNIMLHIKGITGLILMATLYWLLESRDKMTLQIQPQKLSIPEPHQGLTGSSLTHYKSEQWVLIQKWRYGKFHTMKKTESSGFPWWHLQHHCDLWNPNRVNLQVCVHLHVVLWYLPPSISSTSISFPSVSLCSIVSLENEI